MIEIEDISELIKKEIGQPRRLTLNLALPLTDHKFDIGGTMIGIWDSLTATDTIQIRFNENSAPQIPMRRQKVLVVPFKKVFITVPAGLAGNMEIIYGSGTINYFRMYPNDADATAQMIAELQGDLVPENYSTAVIGMAAALVLAANVNRKGFDLQAGLGNAGNVYIGFDNTVTAANCTAALVAGQSYSRNDYRGDLYAIASAAGQLLNNGEV